MEKLKKKSATGGAKTKDRIKDLYKEFVLAEGHQPSSVFTFCKKIGTNEAEFYKSFSSFEAIEGAIWADHFRKVNLRSMNDKNYASFTSREKILTFYFALFESFKGDRSFLTLQLKAWKNPAIVPSFLKTFSQLFSEWSKPVVEAGIQSDEIAKRPYFDSYYNHLLWMHFLFVLQFWAHDQSTNFERTDAAIEKSVTLAFDLIGKGILDNAIDFGKFLYQTVKN